MALQEEIFDADDEQLRWVIAFLTAVLLFYAVKLDQHPDTHDKTSTQDQLAHP